MVTVPEEMTRLMERKASMEAEMGELENYLTQPGNPGLKGGLLDDEGPLPRRLGFRSARRVPG